MARRDVARRDDSCDTLLVDVNALWVVHSVQVLAHQLARAASRDDFAEPLCELGAVLLQCGSPRLPLYLIPRAALMRLAACMGAEELTHGYALVGVRHERSTQLSGWCVPNDANEQLQCLFSACHDCSHMAKCDELKFARSRLNAYKGKVCTILI